MKSRFLKLWIAAAAAVAFASVPALGQPAQILNMTAVLPPGATQFATSIGGVAGSTKACYYLVTNYVGGAIRSAAACRTDIPDTLSGSNYVTLRWTPPTGSGITYDVLKVAYGASPCRGRRRRWLPA